MSDLFSEPRITLAALAKRENVDLSTVYRWHLRGCQGYRLETFVVGGKRFTTLPAFERWCAKLNAADAASHQIPAERERDIDAAEDALDAILGVRKAPRGVRWEQ